MVYTAGGTERFLAMRDSSQSAKHRRKLRDAIYGSIFDPMVEEVLRDIRQRCHTSLAPMVDGSDLAYRLLVRKFGVDLTWSPMYNVNTFCNSKTFQAKLIADLHVGKDIDRPLIVQFAGNTVDAFVSVYSILKDSAENCFDGFEVNLGCPASVAARGHYGSYLMDDPDLCVSILSKLNSIRSPNHFISTKTRIFANVTDTVKFATALIDAGSRVFTLHGRQRNQRTGYCIGAPNWVHIRDVFTQLRAKYGENLVLFVNGGIWNLESHMRCVREIPCNGTMSGNSILDNAGVYKTLDGSLLVSSDPQILKNREAVDKAYMAVMGDTTLLSVAYSVNPGFLERPRDSYMSMDVFQTLVERPSKPQCADGQATVRLADYSVSMRIERIKQALEYIELFEGYVLAHDPSVHCVVAHVMKLLGRDLLAANTDIRKNIVERTGDSSDSDVVKARKYIAKITNLLLELLVRLENSRGYFE